MLRARTGLLGLLLLVAGQRQARAQDWLVLQGIAEGEFWGSDSGSRLLTRNDGRPGTVERMRLFVGIVPTSSVQLVALGELGAGTAYTGSEHAELEAVSLRIALARALVLEGGKLLSPVGAFAPRRLSPVNPLIGEPDAYPSQYPWGGQLSGTASVFDYRIAVVSLPPTHAGYTPTAQARPRVVVGGGVKPLFGTRVGWSYTRGTYLSDSISPALPDGFNWKDYRQEVIALDARASRGYIDFHGEWAYSWYDVPTVATRMKGPAYYLELKYTWTPRFFTAARFQRNAYPFVRPIGGKRWLTIPANFYAGEIGIGFRPMRGLLAKISYQKDDWTNQPSGQAIAVQLSYQFDVTGWIAGRKR